MTFKSILIFVFAGLLFYVPAFAWGEPFNNSLTQELTSYGINKELQNSAISSKDINLILGTDIPYAFKDNSSDLAGSILKSEKWNGDESNITNMLNYRVDPKDPKVINYARSIAGEHPGTYKIEQICAIFNKINDNWTYFSDPHTKNDYLSFPNDTIETCKNGNCSGDCDDFAILMSGLIEAIGGTTRCIWAENTMQGAHAYVEVYLGQLDANNNHVKNIISWLTKKYRADTIYTHIDLDTGDVWLNLDWSEDHPGGSFYPSDRYYVFNIQSGIRRTVPEASKESIGIKPIDYAEIWINIGRTLSNQSKFVEANQCFEKAIKMDSNSSEAWNCSGNALNCQRNYYKAVNAYQEAIKLAPTHAAFWNGLGYSFYYLDEYNESVKALEEAVRLDANLTAAWYNGGEALYHLGYYNESIKAYDRAIELDPKLGYVFSNNNFTDITFPFVVPKEIERNIEQIDIRSQAIGLDSTYFEWNTNNFPGFYYDIDKDIGTEQITVRLSELNRDRPKLSGDRPYGVTYTTTAQNKSFEQETWGSYSAIGFLGEEYFAGYIEDVGDASNLFFEKSVDKHSLVDEQLEKVLIDSDNEITVTSGGPLKLGEGYELVIMSIDIDSNKISLELSKNGAVVDSNDVTPSKDGATVWDKTYYYRPPYVGRQKKLATIGVHFKNAFRGADQNLATVDGIWQISDQPTEVSIDENYDKMSVRSIDANAGTITMDNKDNSITLSKNKDRTLMPGISINIADNDTLRYCIYKRTTDPGTYRIRGAVASSNNLEDKSFTWDRQNFPGFYYDINNDLGTECLKIVISDTNKLSGDAPYGVTYTTTTQTKPFEKEVFGEYKVIGFLGEKYFAGYVESAAFEASNLFFKESVDEDSLLIEEQLEKVLIDSDDEITVTSGKSLKLEEGYELAIRGIDIDGNKVYLQLSKKGQLVDSKIVSPSKDGATELDKIYYYHPTQVGWQKKLVTIGVRFKNAFRGSDQNLATVDGIWQISDQPKEVKIDTEYDKMRIAGVTDDSITMDNKDNVITLSKNKDTTLMRNICIKTADQEIIDDAHPLRYYIYKEITIKPETI